MKKLSIISFFMLAAVMVNAGESKEVGTQELKELWVELLSLNKTIKDVPESLIKHADEKSSVITVDIETGLSRGQQGGGFAKQYKRIWMKNDPEILCQFDAKLLRWYAVLQNTCGKQCDETNLPKAMIQKFPQAFKVVVSQAGDKKFTGYSVLYAFIDEYDKVMDDTSLVFANRRILNENFDKLRGHLTQAVADSKKDLENLRKAALAEGERTKQLLDSPDREYVEQLKTLNDKFSKKN